ncbi:MAG: hypothetical protein J7524_10660 [Roseofilum sp. Belize BBD 4]|uniref:hypothetical protein n=1 Tax=Roseofilum sp. Belize BBD 4 TaxID=2821500 RepID=UPI001B18410F|nr:hypothetical protein [Roseofilum sp. Belize BBD 4]MBP0033614.1 hypothetical protein [Roseofilum sp. Belize BBD 4]
MNKEDFDSKTLDHINEILEWGNIDMESYLSNTETHPAILITQLTSLALERVRALEELVDEVRYLSADFLGEIRQIRSPKVTKELLDLEGKELKEVVVIQDRRISFLLELAAARLEMLDRAQKELNQLLYQHYDFGKKLLEAVAETNHTLKHR